MDIKDLVPINVDKILGIILSIEIYNNKFDNKDIFIKL